MQKDKKMRVIAVFAHNEARKITAFAYVSLMTIIWLIARRPEGAEAYLLKNILHVHRLSKN